MLLARCREWFTDCGVMHGCHTRIIRDRRTQHRVTGIATRILADTSLQHNSTSILLVNMPEDDGQETVPTSESISEGQDVIDLKVEFGGGLETLFSNQNSLKIRLPKPHTIRHLVAILSPQVKPQKSMSLFCLPGPEWDIKPGILPLVNDEDWELLEPSGMQAILKHGDNVMFISTLHGG